MTAVFVTFWLTPQWLGSARLDHRDEPRKR